MNRLAKLSIVAFFALAAGLGQKSRSVLSIRRCRRDWLATTAQAFTFAKTAGVPLRLRPTDAGAWQDADGRLHAPEEFNVIWYHQGDDPGTTLGKEAGSDLLAYLEGGGTLLLSGAAGRVLYDLGIESSPLRLLAPSGVPVPSGVRVTEKHRSHPIFAGFDRTQPILLTTVGGNALADFYGTTGPHGELLAEGTCGQGERPLVEYTVGAGGLSSSAGDWPTSLRLATATGPTSNGCSATCCNIWPSGMGTAPVRSHRPARAATSACWAFRCSARIGHLCKDIHELRAGNALSRSRVGRPPVAFPRPTPMCANILWTGRRFLLRPWPSRSWLASIPCRST